MHVADSQITHQRVSEQVKQAEAAVAKRREPTYQEILHKISAVVGLRGPEKFLVPTDVEGMPNYNLTAEGWTAFQQGRGPAWEEEQRCKREQDQKRLDSEKLKGLKE